MRAGRERVSVSQQKAQRKYVRHVVFMDRNVHTLRIRNPEREGRIRMGRTRILQNGGW